jgi:uncharacterized membrane protein YhaH (DUF805 family)
MEKYLKYFNFEGRATRSEYWGVNIIGYLSLIPIALIGALFTLGGILGAVVGGLLIITGVVALTWAVLATTARRCRDIGINPWFAGTVLIPYIALIPWIIFGCLSTKKEKNDEHFY